MKIKQKFNEGILSTNADLKSHQFIKDSKLTKIYLKAVRKMGRNIG